MSLNIGADPEFAVVDREGKLVLAHILGFGDKQNKMGAPNARFFRDGAVLETNPGVSTNRNVLATNNLEALLEADSKLLTGQKLKAIPAIAADLQEIEAAPFDVQHFGCDPSWDAYTGNVRIIDVNAWEHPWRYCGGHMHLSHDTSIKEWSPLLDESKYQTLVCLLDRLISIPQVILWGNDMAFKRRELYGAPGEFRPQIYADGKAKGLEYRTPGPEMWNHFATVALFYGVARLIVENFDAWEPLYDKREDEAVQRALTTGEGAEDLIVPVPYFYDMSVLKKLKQRPEIHTLELDNYGLTRFTWEAHAANWGIVLPPYTKAQQQLHLADNGDDRAS